MTMKMLISVAHDAELRVAMLQGKTLYDLDIEYPGVEQKKSNIYKGRIGRVEPSLEAAFIDYGADKHGFLPLKEISKIYFAPGFAGNFSNINIRDVLKEGQELIVQIDKEERGTKGAALTTFVSLAGSYVVLMPNNPRAGGISRRIDGQERDDLRETLRNLRIPEDMGVIVRTAGIGKSTEELQWDLDILLHHWDAIYTASATRPAPFLIYQESDTAIRAVRDYLRQDIVEIAVDHKETYDKIVQYLQLVKPDFVERVKFYIGEVPLFSSYQIEKQIESAYQREVRLPSGGAIVIDHTEALVSVDVNSAKSTSGSDIEETALKTNLEAADEIARQLRLRDIGGLIVIDFIDMGQANNQRAVRQKIINALKPDRARVQVGHITRFGLLEMSRQRLRSHIGEAIQVTCPRCDGQGTIRSIEALANTIVHLLEEEATKEKVGLVQIQVPLDLATYLLNEKRQLLNNIETRQSVRVVVLPNQHLETPKYKIKSIKKSDLDKAWQVDASYKLMEAPETPMPERQIAQEEPNEEPAVSMLASPQALPPKPLTATAKQSCHEDDSESGNSSGSVIKNIIQAIFGKTKNSKQKTDEAAAASAKTPGQQRPQPGGNRDRGRNNPRRNQGRGFQDSQGAKKGGRTPGSNWNAEQRGNQQKRNRPNPSLGNAAPGEQPPLGNADIENASRKPVQSQAERDPSTPPARQQNPRSQHTRRGIRGGKRRGFGEQYGASNAPGNDSIGNVDNSQESIRSYDFPADRDCNLEAEYDKGREEYQRIMAAEHRGPRNPTQNFNAAPTGTRSPELSTPNANFEQRFDQPSHLQPTEQRTVAAPQQPLQQTSSEQPANITAGGSSGASFRPRQTRSSTYLPSARRGAPVDANITIIPKPVPITETPAVTARPENAPVTTPAATHPIIAVPVATTPSVTPSVPKVEAPKSEAPKIEVPKTDESKE